MQHRYVGDVGDFGKYALLNALSASGLRLGVIWYLNERSENNADGKFTVFDNLASLAPELFGKLKTIRSETRRLEQIELSGILAENTVFARDTLPFPQRPCYSEASRNLQRKLRRDWFANVLCQVSDSEFVFLDPDNGIAPPSLKLHSTKACKYVFPYEIETLLTSGRSLVVYQHQHRNGTLSQQMEASIRRFSAVAPEAFAISSHVFTVRAYLILPSNSSHARLLGRFTKQFLGSNWKTVFHHGYGSNSALTNST